MLSFEICSSLSVTSKIMQLDFVSQTRLKMVSTGWLSRFRPWCSLLSGSAFELVVLLSDPNRQAHKTERRCWKLSLTILKEMRRKNKRTYNAPQIYLCIDWNWNRSIERPSRLAECFQRYCSSVDQSRTPGAVMLESAGKLYLSDCQSSKKLRAIRISSRILSTS